MGALWYKAIDLEILLCCTGNLAKTKCSVLGAPAWRLLGVRGGRGTAVRSF